MYCVIFTYTGLLEQESQLAQQLRRFGCSWFSPDDLKNGCIIAVSQNIGMISVVKHQLSIDDNVVNVIGVWNVDGSQYGYRYEIDGDFGERVLVVDTFVNENGEEVPVEILYPFNMSAYMNILPDALVYDENGSVVSSMRPTEAYQIHNILGWGVRDLLVHSNG